MTILTIESGGMQLLYRMFVAAVLTTALAGCSTMSGTDGSSQAAHDADTASQSARLLKLAADLEAHGDDGTAIALYQRAAAAPDATPSNLLAVADAYARAGYTAEAIKTYNTVLTRSPKNGLALVGLGSAMVQSGDVEAGIRALTEGAQIVNTGSAYNRLGVAQIFGGRLEDAQATFAKALALSPNDLDFQVNLALASALAGDRDRAMPLIQTIAAAPAAQPRHKRNAVIAYGLVGQAEEVRAAPPTGLTTREIETLLAQARTILSKSTPQARAQALGSIEI